MEDSTSVYALIGQDKYLTKLTKGPYAWSIDEPVSAGGGGKAPSPSDMLTSALCGCMAVTAKMYAERKGWPLESCQIKAHFQKEEDGKYSITTTTTLTGSALTEDQIQRIVQISGRCPLHKLLEPVIKITEIGPHGLKEPSQQAA